MAGEAQGWPWVPRCRGWGVWGAPVPPSWVLLCVPWCRDRRTFPRAGRAHGGGFGEDNVLRGAGWAWWHRLMTPSKAWWHQLAVPSQVWCLHLAVPIQGCVSKRSILIILTAAPRSSPEQGIPLALHLCISPVLGGRGQGLAVPSPPWSRPSRCSPVVGGAPAVFPGKEPLSQFGSVSMATALSFPQRFRSHRSGSWRSPGARWAPGWAGPCPEPGRTMAVPLRGADPWGARRDHPAL